MRPPLSPPPSRGSSSRALIRIVTPVQAEETTWQALEIGAAMAKELRAELRALFLTDADALAAAALPVSHAISYQTGMIRSLEVGMLEAAYRARAARARDRVAELCRTEALRWSFEMTTEAAAPSAPAEPQAAGGTAAASGAEPRTEAEVYDLLLLDPRSLAVQRLATPLLRLLTRHALLGLWDRQAPKPSRVVLFSKGERNALLTAATIARQLDVEQKTWVYGRDAASREDRAAAISDWLAEQNIHVPLEEIATEEGEACRTLLHRHRDDLLLFDSAEILTTALGR